MVVALKLHGVAELVWERRRGGVRARVMWEEGHGSRAQPGWARWAPGLVPRVVPGLLLTQTWQCLHTTLMGTAAVGLVWGCLLWSWGGSPVPQHCLGFVQGGWN